ncbi:MAG: FitA-like ribbon-helix-helix domain-containing protein [Micromonosporaceae bacterium]
MSKTIQIRDVPDRTHTELRSRAAAAGMSLSEYLLREINELASRPSVADVLRRAAERSGGARGTDIVAAVRVGRDRDETA